MQMSENVDSTLHCCFSAHMKGLKHTTKKQQKINQTLAKVSERNARLISVSNNDKECKKQ
jgi:hypothetical protein